MPKSNEAGLAISGALATHWFDVTPYELKRRRDTGVGPDYERDGRGFMYRTDELGKYFTERPLPEDDDEAREKLLLQRKREFWAAFRAGDFSHLIPAGFEACEMTVVNLRRSDAIPIPAGVLPIGCACVIQLAVTDFVVVEGDRNSRTPQLFAALILRGPQLEPMGGLVTLPTTPALNPNGQNRTN